MSKDVLCDKRNTVASLSDDEIHFSWQAQHFGVLHSSFCMAGAALQTCRVACFWQIALSGLHQVVTTCILRGRVDFFLRRVENYFLGFRFGNPFFTHFRLPFREPIFRIFRLPFREPTFSHLYPVVEARSTVAQVRKLFHLFSPRSTGV